MFRRCVLQKHTDEDKMFGHKKKQLCPHFPKVPKKLVVYIVFSCFSVAYE